MIFERSRAWISWFSCSPWLMERNCWYASSAGFNCLQFVQGDGAQEPVSGSVFAQCAGAVDGGERLLQVSREIERRAEVAPGAHVGGLKFRGLVELTRRRRDIVCVSSSAWP